MRGKNFQLNPIYISIIFVLFSIIWFHFTSKLSVSHSMNEHILVDKQLMSDIVYSLIAGINLFVFIKWQNDRFLKIIDKLSNREHELKDALDKEEILLTEVHHRVKNNLAMISGLMDLQLLQTEDEDIRYLLTNIQIRLKSIALVHETLYQDFLSSEIRIDDYLHGLIHSIQNLYQNVDQNIELNMDIEPLSLDLSHAVPFGLLTTELLTNAYKHAFPDNRSGRIDIQLKNLGDNKYELYFKDNGVGLNDNLLTDQPHTLGFKLIQTLTKQLKAHIKLDLDNGFGVSLVFNNPTKIPAMASKAG